MSAPQPLASGLLTSPAAPLVHPVQVVVFAKAPLPGRAKTRLAPALGVAGAARLAQLLLHDTLARVAAACQLDAAPHTPQPTGVTAGPERPPRLLRPELCSAPGPGHADWLGALPHGPQAAAGGGCWAWTDQGDGDLGQRMASASQRVTAAGHAVLLVGTDCPSLSPALLRQAAQQLQHHDAVLLPAADGGYVLLGLRQHVPELFEHMPWSTAQVAAITLSRLQALGLSVWQGPTLHDVDELADLARLPSFLRSLFLMTPAGPFSYSPT